VVDIFKVPVEGSTLVQLGGVFLVTVHSWEALPRSFVASTRMVLAPAVRDEDGIFEVMEDSVLNFTPFTKKKTLQELLDGVIEKSVSVLLSAATLVLVCRGDFSSIVQGTFFSVSSPTPVPGAKDAKSEPPSLLQPESSCKPAKANPHIRKDVLFLKAINFTVSCLVFPPTRGPETLSAVCMAGLMPPAFLKNERFTLKLAPYIRRTFV
jgi:hypothetical protein